VEISILTYTGKFTGDIVSITTGSGDFVYNFTTAPLSSWNRIVSSNDVVFTFDITNPIDLIFTVKAVSAPATTTTTTPSPTTSPYNGIYGINPALTMVDLTVAIDMSSTNQYFTQCTNVLQSIANIFSYNYNDLNSGNARLSFFAFTPTSGVGFGLSEPWSLDNNTLKNMWLNLKPVTGTSDSSKFFKQFNDYFGLIMNGDYNYNFRTNVQRVFLYCTSGDVANPDPEDVTSIDSKITGNDLKIVVINMDPAKSFNGQYFPYLYGKLPQDGSNKANGYTTNDPANTNLKDIVDNYIQNGNQLCNVKVTDVPVVVKPGESSSTFGVPMPYGIQYCNYMNVIREYDPDNNKVIQFNLNNVYLNYDKDFITISVNNTNISKFTGYDGFIYFCVSTTENAKLTFTSVGDKVYGGFNVTVKGFDDLPTCQKNPPSPPNGDSKFGQYPQYKLIHL